MAGLRRLREDPGSAASLGELRRVLARESSLAAARAAAIAGDFALTALVPDLASAIARFFEEPVKTDPGCKAKTAIVEALRRLDH
ncbi:MAG TPA: hypothetical protein VLI67_04770, partial [Vicinamibacteria bacterium]|nr:hypothetical protein [Vicinamibacteria bacterium]